MPFAAFIPAITAGISALGGLFGNRGTKQENTGTSSSTMSGTSGYSNASGSYANPTLLPQGQGMLDSLLNQYMQGLGNVDLTGYKNAGISNINRMSDISGRNIEEKLAGRGIFGPAVGTALAGNEMNRASQINQFSGQIPLMQQDLMMKYLGLGGDIFRSIPYGNSQYNEQYGSTEQNQTQNSTQTGNASQPGNMLGGLFGNLGPVLAYLFGQGAFGGGGGSTPNSMRRTSPIPLQ